MLGLLTWLLGPKLADVFVSQPTTTNAPTVRNKITTKTPADANVELEKFITPTTGETWLATPKAMTAQGWLKSELVSTYTDYDSGSGSTVTAEQQRQQQI